MNTTDSLPTRLKFFAEIVAGQSPNNEDVSERGDLPFIQGCAEFGDWYPVATKYCEVAPKIAEPRDVLISVRAPVGELNIAQHRLGIGRGVAAVRARSGLDSRFIYWLLSSSKELLRSYATGTTFEAVSSTDIGNLPFQLVGRADQERIANFLDAQTARIDALIAEKERLVNLLKDVLSDEVTRAVTVGIDAAQTKATNLDWCPNVPMSWDVLLLRRLFERTEYGISESMSSEGQVAVLRMGNIADGRVLMSDLKYVDSADSSLVLKPGDVLYNRTNSLAQVGKVGLVRELPDLPVIFASYLVRLVPNKRVLPEYLAYLLNCPDVLAIARSLALPAIGQANLNPTRYGYIHVPCPPIDEQRRIVAHLDEKTIAVGALADHVQTHISRLREYRSSLISAAVTGQLDVGRYRGEGNNG